MRKAPTGAIGMPAPPYRHGANSPSMRSRRNVNRERLSAAAPTDHPADAALSVSIAHTAASSADPALIIADAADATAAVDSIAIIPSTGLTVLAAIFSALTTAVRAAVKAFLSPLSRAVFV